MYKQKYKLIILILVLSIFITNSFITYVCFAASETTKKPSGFKLEGAVFHEELWEKYRVIAPEGGGANGEGGGASDTNANNAGNSGEANSSGGMMGKSAGIGTTGSKTADQIRAVQEAIRESQEKERQKELETALDRVRASESIKERESIQESIKKRMAQESVKSKIITAPSIYETIKVTTEVVETEYSEVVEPTSRANIIIQPEKEINESPTIDENPTINEIQQTTIDNIYSSPETVPENSPIESYNESSIQEAIEKIEKMIDESESIRMSEALEKKGTKGGIEIEEETNKSEDSDTDESAGVAKEEGMYQLETSGDHAGKKVFLLDDNGNIGFDKDRLTISSIRWLMKILIISLFIIGALVFILGTKDKKHKRGYF